MDRDGIEVITLVSKESINGNLIPENTIGLLEKYDTDDDASNIRVLFDIDGEDDEALYDYDQIEIVSNYYMEKLIQEWEKWEEQKVVIDKEIAERKEEQRKIKEQEIQEIQEQESKKNNCINNFYSTNTNREFDSKILIKIPDKYSKNIEIENLVLDNTSNVSATNYMKQIKNNLLEYLTDKLISLRMMGSSDVDRLGFLFETEQYIVKNIIYNLLVKEFGLIVLEHGHSVSFIKGKDTKVFEYIFVIPDRKCLIYTSSDCVSRGYIDKDYYLLEVLNNVIDNKKAKIPDELKNYESYVIYKFNTVFDQFHDYSNFKKDKFKFDLNEFDEEIELDMLGLLEMIYGYNDKRNKLYDIYISLYDKYDEAYGRPDEYLEKIDDLNYKLLFKSFIYLNVKNELKSNEIEAITNYILNMEQANQIIKLLYTTSITYNLFKKGESEIDGTYNGYENCDFTFIAVTLFKTVEVVFNNLLFDKWNDRYIIDGQRNKIYFSDRKITLGQMEQVFKAQESFVVDLFSKHEREVDELYKKISKWRSTTRNGFLHKDLIEIDGTVKLEDSIDDSLQIINLLINVFE